mgnify:CR=1 FL=1
MASAVPVPGSASYDEARTRPGSGGPLASELQRLVDSLAARLDRAVVLEDRRQRLLAYSQHDEPMDSVRRDSILQRQTTPEVMGWLRRFGITDAEKPLRIPANPALDLLPRVCIPVRHQDLLLGFLWFIDADESMTTEEIDLAATVANDFALALYRENLVEELAQRHEHEAVRNLLLSDPEARRHAAAELIDSGIVANGPVTALVVRPVFAEGTPPDAELVRLAIEHSLVQAKRHGGYRQTLNLPRFDHGLLLAVSSSSEAAVPVSTYGRVLVKTMEKALGSGAGLERVVVGVGEPQDELAQADRSYEQARQAAHVAASLPGLGPVADWSELGVYRALAQLSADQVGITLLHPGLVALLDDAENHSLAQTLETYLDLAGNAQATAKALRLHRATLYYRLQRIEDLTSADLKDGNDRLTLHLGLKLARLNGRYSPSS